MDLITARVRQHKRCYENIESVMTLNAHGTRAADSVVKARSAPAAQLTSAHRALTQLLTNQRSHA